MKTISLNLAKMALYLFVGLSVIFISCSGEDGETGPAGKDGIDGKDGEDGNANVIVSDWMPFVWDYTNGYTIARMDIPVEGIMDFIESGGVIMLFLRDDSNGTRIQTLPIYSTNNSYYFYYGERGSSFLGIWVYVVHSDLESIENNPEIRVRYVLVPANVAEASGLADKIPENFNEAAAMLGLQQ